ncbi:MAG: RDD family protein [Ilumatobacteraceae bacterium]
MAAAGSDPSASSTLGGPLQLADVDGIVTPEAVVLEVETAGLASRVFAGLLDLLIQAGILLLALIVVGLVLRGRDDSTQSTIGLVMVAAVLMGYPVISEVLMRGRTIGKRAFGLRAVTLEGAPIRFRHAALRMMGGLVDRLLPPGGITGVLFVLGTRRHQRVGDLLAGTIVIRDPDRTPLPVAVWFPVPFGLDGFAATIDPTAMTDEQYTVIRSFLLRSRLLTVAARYSLGVDLADRIAVVVRCPRPATVHPEAYLLCVISRYQRRTFPEYRSTTASAAPPAPFAQPPPAPPWPLSQPVRTRGRRW